MAYLVSRYPDHSHTFIRREIRAQERCGLRVQVYSVRPPPGDLVDPTDGEEAARVRVILRAGVLTLLADLLSLCLRRPRRMMLALGETLSYCRRAGGRVVAHLAYLVEASHLVRRLERDPVDILHAHFGTNPACVAVLARLLGGPPVVFTVHGPEEFAERDRFSLAAKVSRAAVAICVCEHGAALLRGLCAPDHAARVHVVHCGLEEEVLARPRRPLPAAWRIAAVGRLCEEKRHRFLLEAVAELACGGMPVSLVLVGDGPLRRELEGYLQEHGLASLVTLTGWLPVSEVMARLESARVVALSSQAEGLPVALMEALAVYRPAVATAVCGVPELIDRTTGWLVPPGDAPALAQALRAALTADDVTLTRMGTCGHDRVRREFDIDTEAAKLREIYRQVVAGSAHRSSGAGQG